MMMNIRTPVRANTSYIKAINEDIRYFKSAFSKIEHKVNIAGLDADKAAAQIISELNL